MALRAKPEIRCYLKNINKPAGFVNHRRVQEMSHCFLRLREGLHLFLLDFMLFKKIL